MNKGKLPKKKPPGYLLPLVLLLLATAPMVLLGLAANKARQGRLWNRSWRMIVDAVGGWQGAFGVIGFIIFVTLIWICVVAVRRESYKKRQAATLSAYTASREANASESDD